MLDYSPDQSTDGARVADEWAATLAELSRELQAEHLAIEGAAAGITTAAVDLLTGVDLACVTVVERRGTILSYGPTEPILEKLNAVQQRAEAGPCLSALSAEPIVIVHDVPSDPRWPEYMGTAAEMGIATVLSVRLYVSDRALGALSLYSWTPGVFTDELVAAAQEYAAHAAVAFDAARERENLRAAVDSRDRIGQAKGILMERLKISDDEAFALLVKTSQESNVPVRLIVDELTVSGELPDR